MINYSFYESTKKLTIGVIESGVTIVIFVIATIIWVRGKITVMAMPLLWKGFKSSRCVKRMMQIKYGRSMMLGAVQYE